MSSHHENHRPLPVVTPDGIQGVAGQDRIALESDAWFVWLDGTQAFVYTTDLGSFTVRRERRGAGPGYWRATKKQSGRLRRIYLGRTANLTAARLTHIADTFFAASSPVAIDAGPAGHRPAPEAWFRSPAVSGMIARPHLIRRLTSGATQRLTVISGPPGSGKTTLLALWAQYMQRHGECVGWITLRALPGLPQSFWATVLAACDRALGHPPRSFAGICTAAQVIDALGAPTTNLVLILDGYDAIQDPAIHADLAALLEHPDLPLQLVIAARSRPPLPLARLRAHNHLLEIQPAELAWSADEAAPLLAQILGRPLLDEELTSVLAASVGWLAGLRLAALTLRDHGATLSAAEAAHGANPYLAAYLHAEVVLPLAAHLQQFIRDIAPLPTLTVSLVAAALDCTPAEVATALEALVQAGAMVTPLDLSGERFQLHPQLAAALVAQETRDNRAHQRRIQSRAAHWYAAHEQPDQAISIALAADDVALAAEVLATHGTAQLLMGRVHAVGRWLDAIPVALRWNHPQLTVLAAWEAILRGQPQLAHTHAAAALALLDRIEAPALRASVEGEALAAHAIACLAEHDLPAVAQYAAAAARVLPPSNRYLHGLLQRLGTLDPGEPTALDPGLLHGFTQTAAAAEIGQERALAVAAHTQAGDLARSHGEFQAASLSYRHALRLTDRADQSPVAALAYIGLGAIAYERDQLDEAAQFLQQGIDLAEHGGLVAAVAEGYCLLGRVALARGDCRAAAAWSAHLQTRANHLPLPAGLAVSAAALAIEVALREDDHSTPFALLPALLAGVTDGANPSVLLTLVRVLVQRDEAERAQELATAARIRLEAQLGGVIEVRARVAEALAHDACNDRQAVTIVQPALHRAEQAGAVRSILDAGPSILPMLQASHTAGRCRGFVAALIARLGGALPSDLPLVVEPLTTRERALLRLLAAGESFAAIAATLGLRPSTVKWHAANLYSKLGVRSRAQAVARGRILTLL